MGKQRTGLKLVFFVCVFSERFSSQLNTMRAVDESVEDGVCERGLSDDFMPVCHWHLAGDER